MYISNPFSFLIHTDLPFPIPSILTQVMEAKERKESRNNSFRSHQSSRVGTVSSQRSTSQHDVMNPALNAKVLGDKLRIAKLRLPEVDPDSVMD